MCSHCISTQTVFTDPAQPDVNEWMLLKIEDRRAPKPDDFRCTKRQQQTGLNQGEQLGKQHHVTQHTSRDQNHVFVTSHTHHVTMVWRGTKCPEISWDFRRFTVFWKTLYLLRARIRPRLINSVASMIAMKVSKSSRKHMFPAGMSVLTSRWVGHMSCHRATFPASLQGRAKIASSEGQGS